MTKKKQTKPATPGRIAKPKAKGMGKRKGSAFEREVCKKLSLWVSGGKNADLFWRSAMSGGRATVARKNGKLVRQAGDVCAVTPEGHPFTDFWYIECKHYKTIDLGQFVVTYKGKLAEWWKKARREARAYGKEPMLIVKQNGWPAMLFTRPGLCGPLVPVIYATHPVLITRAAAAWPLDSVLMEKPWVH